MMKKVTLILTTVLIILCCSLDCHAAKKYVFDKSDLFSNSTIEQLEEDANLYSTSDDYKFDMVVVTTDDSKGKTATEYADDYYDNLIDKKGYSEDGILLLIAMDTRQIAISTSGACIDYFDDEDIDFMIENITYDLSDGAYDDACEYFSQKCGFIVESYKNPVDSNESYDEKLTVTDNEKDKEQEINKQENIDKDNQNSDKKEATDVEQKPKYHLIAAACIIPSMIISGIITICKFSDEDGYYSDGNYYVKDSKSVSSSIIKSDFIIEHSNDNLEYDHVYETVINEPDTEPEKVKSEQVKPKPKKATTTKIKSSSARRTTHISSSGREHGGASGSFDNRESSSSTHKSSSRRNHGEGSGSF